MRAIGILFSIALPALAVCQSSQSTSPLFTTSGAFFALSVADLAASTRWYSEKMGLRVVMQSATSGNVAVNVLEGGGLIVELVQRDDARSLRDAAGTAPDLVHGIFKVGMIVDDFDGTVARIRARGVEIMFGPFPPRDGQRANMLVKDNAGNLIQFFGK